MAFLSGVTRWLRAILLPFAALVLGPAGETQAQHTEVEFHARSEAECFQRCDGACGIAYYFPGISGDNCRWTTESRPNLRTRGAMIWSGRHRVRLTLDNLAALFPQAVIEFRDRLPSRVVADAEARLRVHQPALTDLAPRDSEIVTAGANACRGRLATTGRLWIFLYGHINNSHYREHRGFICSEAGNRFFVPDGRQTLERYDCSADFHDCRRNAGYDAHIGAALGPDSHGATQRWQMTNGPGGSASGAILARF